MGKKMNRNPFNVEGDPFGGVIPLKPDTFPKNIPYETLLRWSFALTFAKIQELLANPYQEMTQKAFPFNVMILTFEKILAPVMDDELRKQIRSINAEFINRHPTGKFWFDAAYGLEHLEAIVKFLHRAGLLDTSPPELVPEVSLDDVLDDLPEADDIE